MNSIQVTLLFDEGVAKGMKGLPSRGTLLRYSVLFRVLRKRRSLEYLSVNGRLRSRGQRRILVLTGLLYGFPPEL